MNQTINNLASTVTASSLAAALLALFGPWYKTHYGAELTMEQAAAIVAVLAAGLHGVVALPTILASWIVTIRAALQAPTAQGAAADPQPLPSLPKATGAILLALLMAPVLAACGDDPAAAVQSGIQTANAGAAKVGSYLPDACAALAVAHGGFQLAEVVSTDVAQYKAKELEVYTNLTTGGGICSAASQANPPANAAELIAVAYSQVRVFIPTLPGAPVAPAPAAVVPVSAPVPAASAAPASQ